MARPAKNRLRIVPIRNGRWLLHGYFQGRQIRKRSLKLDDLEAEKLTLEKQLTEAAEIKTGETRLASVRTSVAQQYDAEAALQLLPEGRTLVQAVNVANRHWPPVSGKTCIDALSEWLAALAKRKRSARTEDKNNRRVLAFLTHCGAKKLEEIKPLMIENYVLREKRADYTKITDAQVVRAWLNFCVQRRWLMVSPFELDMKDLSATARTKEPARILSPEQCHALLGAARRLSKGKMVPYTILATWCFMSPQEIIRTTRAKMKLDGIVPVIEVDTVKRRTAKFRTVTVPPNVLPLLREAVKDWPETQDVDVNGKKSKVPYTVPLVRVTWDRIREAAGLLGRNKAVKGRKTHKDSLWQGSILRHTGISYLNQALTLKAHRGEFNDKSVIAEVCRQAGNTTDTSFRHYLNLPDEGASDRFYGPIS